MNSKKLRLLSASISLLFLVMVSGFASANSMESNCTGYKTYSQGGWGNPTNPQGVLLAANFSTVFPNGITLGNSVNYLKFTSASAVANFLPAGGTPSKIGNVTLTNPTTSSAGTLAGQLLAVMINAEVDAKLTNFALANGKLYDLKISKGIFLDYTVRDLITEANQFIAGKVTSYSASEMTSALESIIMSYHEGEMAEDDEMYLVCPIKFTSTLTHNKCFGEALGKIELANIEGARGSNYSFSWSNSSTTSSSLNLIAGTYYLTTSALVSTGKYITRKDTFIITHPTLLTSASNATAILCNGGDATITVSANGGTAPYSGIGTFTVKVGTYEYTVTDANGCTSITNIVVSEPTVLTSTSNATAILCNGGDATITVSANGGTAPYSGTGTFTVKAGTYEYTVTDANGCTSITNILVSEPTLLTSTSNATAILCNGGDATITVSANGGIAPYSGTGTFTVKAGTHEYTVTDANGCSSITNIVVTEPTILSVGSSATPILCNGGQSTITIVAYGGTAPYNGIGDYMVNAGTYEYTVIDANGCSISTSISVTEPIALVLSGSTTDDASCNGGNATGSATINVSGGIAPFNYTWTNAISSTNVATSIAYNITPSVLVTDANGCTSAYTFNKINCTVIVANCEPLKTFTQGGWGSTPNGNNPGAYLNTNFVAAFPSGLTIGSGTQKAIFTSALAIRNFLPSGGPSVVLPKSILTNPTKTTLKNTLAGQLVAASLNVGFDTYFVSFAAPSTRLVDMYCNFAPFKGVTVGTLISEANKAIGGGVSKYTLTQLNDALSKLNENYDNGNTNKGNFICQPVASKETIKSSSNEDQNFNVYPNPATDNFTVNFSSNENTSGSFKIFNLSGQLIYENTIEVVVGLNSLNVNLNELNQSSNLLLVNITFSDNNLKKMIVIK